MHNVSFSRLKSLDVFRGLCIFYMLLIDYPGDWDNVSSIFEHSHWNGFTPADAVFPSFIFIVGLAMVFSFRRRLEQGISRGQIMVEVMRRSVILFVLGLIANAFIDNDPIYNIHTLRIMGVLQRIAIAYLASAFLYLYFPLRGLIYSAIGILVGYWVLFTFIPVPGFGLPDLSVHPLDGVANMATWADGKFLGRHVAPWIAPADPECLLGSFTSIVTCLLGIFAGLLLMSDKSKKSKLIILFCAGIILMILGGIWGVWFPINKQLWTSSFVLFAGGISFVLFSCFYYLLDIKEWSRWSYPFEALGKNAIMIFFTGLCLQGLFYRIPVHVGEASMPYRSWIYNLLYQPIGANPLLTSFYYALSVALFWMMVSIILHRRKIYVRL